MKTILARVSKEKIGILDDFIKSFEGKTGVRLDRVKADNLIMRSMKDSGFLEELDFDLINNRKRKSRLNVQIKL